MFWDVVLQRLAGDTKRAIELAVPAGGFTSGASEVAGIFAENYEKLGRDDPPAGNTFDMAARARQDAQVRDILARPIVRGRVGHDVTVGEILRLIARMQYGKSPGRDFVSTDLLKLLAKEVDDGGSTAFFDTLRMLFNMCLEQGQVPSDWSVAMVKVLYKKGDRSDWRNYRLISLLSVVSKLFEAVLAARLSAYLDESGGLSPFQCGFRAKRRCQHHSFVLAEAIKSNARRGKRTYAAFLDVRKAYPTMRRAAMLARLYDKLGDGQTRCRVWTVIERMLREENCLSRVVVDGAESGEYAAGHGVREGAVLSPVLYAVFIDGIVRRLAACRGVTVGGVQVRALLYADDICLLSDTPDDLRAQLAEAQAFADESSYEYSMDKSISGMCVMVG